MAQVDDTGSRLYAVLQLENIGPSASSRDRWRYGAHVVKRPWVARITGKTASGGYRRTFLRGQLDCYEANSRFTRGVYFYYALRPGVYEVHEMTDWGQHRRYFCRSANAHLTEMSRTEVDQWLAQQANTD